MRPEQSPSALDAASGRLSVWDAGSLVVGIVIGTTIFKSPGYIASQTSSPAQLLGLWALGGVLAFLGALCYAELGATYGKAGGDYYYQTRAFGPWAGFLFGWTQLVVVQTVNIGLFASIFAESLLHLLTGHEAEPAQVTLTAAASVAALTMINLVGMQFGKITQNLLTLAKIAGIGALILTATAIYVTQTETEVHHSAINPKPDWTVALILILYAYGGWNDAAYVVTDVRQREQNVPIALMGGVAFITVVYLAVTVAYLVVLGYDGLQQSQQPPADLMTVSWGKSASQGMSFLVMISALGAVNGLILSVSRLHAAVAADHRLFGWMGRWSTRHDAPIGSLVVQAALTVVLLGLVGLPAGQVFLDRCFQAIVGQPLPWKDFGGGFDLLVAVGAPVFWLFFLATGIAFFVLRVKDRQLARPFRTPGFPVTPALFCGMCLFGIFASVRWAKAFTLLGLAPVVLGVVVYLIERVCFRPSLPRGE